MVESPQQRAARTAIDQGRAAFGQPCDVGRVWHPPPPPLLGWGPCLKINNKIFFNLKWHFGQSPVTPLKWPITQVQSNP